MAKYLDNTGVQYLWNKIKNYVDSKVVGGLTYSTSEQFTGDYNYDGKKIYCITYTFTTSSYIVTLWTGLGFYINDLYRIIDIKGYSDDGTQYNTYPRYENPEIYLMFTFLENKELAYKFSGYTNKKITITIRYTKTTE